VRNFFAILILSFLYLPAHSNIDSLILVTKTKKDTNAVMAGYELGLELYTRDLDSASYFLENAVQLSEQINYSYGTVLIYKTLGGLVSNGGRYEEGLQWLEKGIKLVDSLNLPSNYKVDLLTNIGVAHYRKGLLGKAIETYIVAVDICRLNGLDKHRSRLLNNLGIFYRSLKRYEEAIGIYKQAFDLRAENGDSLGMANILFNMAASHSKLFEHKKAITALNKAEAIYKENGQEDDAIHCLIAKAVAYYELKDSEQAYKLYKEALSFPYDELEIPFNYDLYSGIAKVSLERGEITNAKKYLDKIADAIVESNFAQQQMEFHEISSSLFTRTGEYKKALESRIALEAIQEEIAKDEKSSFRQEMETKYLTSEKEYQIDLLNTKNELTETKLRASRNRNISLGIGLLAIAGFALWLIKLYRKTRKQKEVISVAIREKDMLLKEIHHRVKNNLQVISSLLRIQSRYVKDENAVSALNEGQNRVQSMALIHENLYGDENTTGVDMRKYIPSLADNIFRSYNIEGDHIKIEYEIDELKLDEATVIPIGLVLNELISNALKYAFTDIVDGLLKISLHEKEDTLRLKVEDNGIGMDEKVVTGFGTKLIQSFTNKLDGEMNIKSDNGAVVEIVIKNYQAA